MTEPPGVPEILSALDGAASVLDVGCGSGRLAVELGARGAAVTGIDVSDGALAIARDRAARAGLAVRFMHADMTGPLPFADAEFAAGVSRLALMIAPDPVAVLRELARVVAPGGRIVTAVWARIEENAWFGEPRAAVAAALGPERAAFARVFGRLGEVDELVGLHLEAGLEAEGTVVRDALEPRSAAEHWRDLTGRIGHFTRLAAELTPAEEAAVVRELERRLGGGGAGGLRLGRSLVVVIARSPTPV
ncbi:MAG TPA: class I SAM-dependent methyltransferase [Gaiellales bacterium]|nr:class I SAM-dependent methyltransferase [Gaiellales bacterium]